MPFRKRPRSRKRPYRRRAVRRYKRYSRVKSYKGRSRGGASGHRVVGRQVAMLRPITLKPNFVLRRVQAYHSIAIQPGLPQWAMNAQNDGMRGMGPLYIKIRANSIWPYAAQFQDTLTYLTNSGTGGGQGGTPAALDPRDEVGSIKSNAPLPTVHADDAPVNQGTSYPGIFDENGNQAASPGQQWLQQCVVGSKVTVTATPIMNVTYGQAESREQPQAGAPVGLFGFVHHGPANIEPLHRGTPEISLNSPYAATTIDDIYKRPFSKVRKIMPLVLGGGRTLTGDTQGSNTYVGSGQSNQSSLQISYAPKKAAGVKDLTDNPKMWSHTYPSAAGFSGTHPTHEDYIYIGIDKLNTDCLTNADAPHAIRKPMQAITLQIRLDAMVAFRAPASKTNFAVLGRGADAMDDGGD